MILRLMDYRGNITEHDIGELDTIARIGIRVVTGDEIATVVYKDCTTRKFDTRNDRLADYDDGEYELYDYRSNDNLLDQQKWKDRRCSYWFYGYETEP